MPSRRPPARGRGRAAAQTQQHPAVAPGLAVAGVTIGVLLTVGLHLPGVLVAWLAFIVGAWSYPPAELTGKKDSNGYPTAAHAGEAKAMRKYRFWSDLKWRMFSPNPDWMPGWPVYASTAIAVAVGVACAYFDRFTPWLSGLLAYILVAQVAAVRRRNSTLGEPCPGTRFGNIKRLPEDMIGFAWRFAAGAAGGVAALWTVAYAFTLVPKLNYEMPGLFGYLSLALLGGLCAIGPWWSNLSIGHWRVVVAARKEWEPRWEMLKYGDNGPYLIDRQEVGPFVIDTFDAPGNMGSRAFYTEAPKILPTIGTNTQVFILPVENVDGDGQPIPNTQHPLRFRVVTTTSDGMPDLTDPNLEPDIAKMAFEVAVVGGCIEMGAGVPVIGNVTMIAQAPSNEPESSDDTPDDAELEEMLKDFPPDVAQQIRDEHEAKKASAPPPAPPADVQAAWMVEIEFPFGPGMKWCHEDLEESVAGRLGVEVCFDHRNYNVMFAGVLTDPNQQLADVRQQVPPRNDVDVAEAVRRIAVEDDWISRWVNVLKTNVNFPVVEHSLYKEFELRDGTKIFSQTFVTLRGDDVVGTYFGLEEKLKTALEHIPFVATTGYLYRHNRRGERHPQAFDVIWSEGPIPPNPDKLPPPMRPAGLPPAQHAVLRGRVNEAFKAARLAQPEVYDVQCLTAPRSRGHIWKIKVRLYGGVTLAEVRGAQQKLKQAWASDWLRVTESPTGDGIIIVAGANPARVTPADETVMAELVSLDWEQAWLDANTRGVGGVTPKLTKVDVLPDNQKVQVLDFTLPSGLSIEEVRQAKKRLMASTSNAFIDIRPNPDNNPSHIRLLACPESPMPYPVSYDFDYVDTLDGLIPFATGVEGRPILFDVKTNPHALILGGSGSGKSAAAQNLMYGALVQGFDVAMIDIQKQGADFKFAEDRCVAFARNVPEAVATMEAIYAEVKRRAHISGQVGASHVREWENPPPPIVVFIDEFKGVLMAGKKPSTKPEEDPDLEKARLEAMQIYDAKKRIGFLTGRIAAEARSADVHLFLMTQRLMANDLDDEVKDLKALALDTNIPVPVSKKFPTGWATNADLSIGDLVFNRDGQAVPVSQFSEEFLEDTYKVTFDDGQTVVTNGAHLWTASSKKTRRAWSAAGYTMTAAEREDFANLAETLAATVQVGSIMSLSELTELVGLPTVSATEAFVKAFGIDLYIRNGAGRLEVADRAVRLSSPVRVFNVGEASSALGTDLSALGEWATRREIYTQYAGVDSPTKGQLHSFGGTLSKKGITFKDGEREQYAVEVSEFLTMLARHLRSGENASLDALNSYEEVVSTEEMYESQNLKWAVPMVAIGGPDRDLPVDPYVLGAWLGDGNSRQGIFTSGRSDACRDDDGVTDHEHLMRRLDAAGYDPKTLDCDDTLIGTRGLTAQLRDLGVLGDKHIPAEYLRASYEQRLELLRGLMDTDGSTNGRAYSIGQSNERLAEGVLELIRSLGIKAHVHRRRAWYSHPDTGQRVDTKMTSFISFRTDVEVFALPRKKAKAPTPVPNGRTTRRSIVSIEKIASVPTRCIAVDSPDHQFLVEGFVPTHNTNLARILLGKTNSGEKASALRDPFNTPDLGEFFPKGRGLWESVEETAEGVQFWYAGSADYRKNLIERVPEVTDERRLAIEEYLPKPIELDEVAFSVVSKGPSLVPQIAVDDDDDDIVLKSIDFNLDELDDEEDGEEYDLSALGIEIVDDDDDDDDDAGDSPVSDVGDELDWGDDFESDTAPEPELDWGDFPTLDTSATPDVGVEEDPFTTEPAANEVDPFAALRDALNSDDEGDEAEEVVESAPAEESVVDDGPPPVPPLPPEPVWAELPSDFSEIDAGPVGAWPLEDLVDTDAEDTRGESQFGWIIADHLLDILLDAPGITKISSDDETLFDEVEPGVTKADLLAQVAATRDAVFVHTAPPPVPALPGGVPAAPPVMSPLPAPVPTPEPVVKRVGDQPSFVNFDPEPVMEPEVEVAPVIVPVAPPDPSKVTDDF